MIRSLLFSCTTALALTLMGCGGSSSSSSGSPPGNGDTTPPETEFQVTASVTGSGEASPMEQTLAEGEQASIALTPDEGFRIGDVSGCGGELQGSDYVTAPLTADCEVSISFIQGGGASGALQPPPDTAVDGTLNDRASTLEPNSECARAQDIDSRGTLHGFAAADATGGDPDEEHFADEGDTSDFYRTYLNVGQVMQLEVSDFSEGSRDLSLHLWNADCSRQLDSSDSGDMEEVSSVLGGDRVIEVRAEAGASKYVLRGSTAWDSSEADEASLLDLSEAMPDFAPYEVIISFESGAGASPHASLSEALNQALGLQLNFRQENTGRASLATIQEPGGGLPDLDGDLSPVMQTLRELNSEAFDRVNTQRIIDFLAQQPGVRYAEPNFAVATQQTEEPDDPLYDDQWHYTQIELPEAWNLTTGFRDDGEHVVVAVLDTGVYLGHEDLQGKLLPDGWDFHDGNSDPDETSGASSWHGTHVAGTVGAATDNNTGVAGVSWGAQILPVRVLGDEGGSRYNVMQGVRYAAGLPNDSGTTPPSPAQVINLSLGGGGHTRSEQNLYNEVRDRGTVVVAAAGNDSSDQPFYPASYDGVLSVSATNCNNELASYSNFGPTISLAAPGGDARVNSCGDALNFIQPLVLSTVGEGSGNSRSSDYRGLQGTSMAAPHVSGVLALMFAQYPSLTPVDVDNLLVNGELTDSEQEGRNNDFGYGEINARKSVEAARALDEGDGWPARVVANPSTLFLEQDDEATLELRQQGEGEAPAVVSFTAEADWLSVAEEDVDARGLGDYRVTVDRSHFSDEETGRFQSEVIFTLEDESELPVEVHILVGSASATAPIYVVLLDPETDEVAHEVLAERTEEGELVFEFADIPPGDYRLMAGSDIDADGLICQAGEMCGAFPSYEEREILTIEANMLEERDFVIDILSGFRPLAGEPPQAILRQ